MAAFFRLNHKPISLQGRKHGGGTAGAATYGAGVVDYVGRERSKGGQSPCGIFLSGVTGASTRIEVASWMRKEMLHNERSNGRIGERIIAHFPREFTHEQRVEAVQKFAADVTENGRIPWFAGVHDLGKDAANPHVHIVFRDRHSEQERRLRTLQGERVVKGQNVLGWLSKMATKEDIGSTERFREKWAAAVNSILERTTYERVDHRSSSRQAYDEGPSRATRPLRERARRAISARKERDRAIVDQAAARLEADVAAGKIDGLTKMAKLAGIRNGLREKTSSASASWGESIAKSEGRTPR